MFYSNNDEAASCEYFWREFDPAAYSIWRGDYRFNKELDKVNKCSNLRVQLVLGVHVLQSDGWDVAKA